jgi:K+-sensing histidine kinase KdpD
MRWTSVPVPAPVARTGDPRCPDAYGLAIAYGALLVLIAVLSALRAHLGLPAQTTVVVAGVAVLAWWVRPWAALGAAGLGWLFLNGFLVNRQGDLRWHGRDDTVRIVLLAGVAVAVSAARSVQLARQRYRRIPPSWPVPQLDGTAPDETLRQW